MFTPVSSAPALASSRRSPAIFSHARSQTPPRITGCRPRGDCQETSTGRSRRRARDRYDVAHAAAGSRGAAGKTEGREHGDGRAAEGYAGVYREGRRDEGGLGADEGARDGAERNRGEIPARDAFDSES